MRTVSLTIVLAVLLGLGIGVASATLRARHAPPLPGAKVQAESDSFDFGEMDSKKEGSHDFTITNSGAVPLLLSRGVSNCRCTVGEIENSSLAPGQSTTVHVTWKSKHTAGPFKQSVTIRTNAPERREVVLTINGLFTESLHVDPDELDFGEISGSEPISRESQIFYRLPNLAKRIVSHTFTEPTLAQYFRVDIRPLAADDLKPQPSSQSGVVVKVTAKPGLPPGTFRQTILLQTDLPDNPETRLTLFGTVGKEVAIVGSGWDNDQGVLTIGSIKAGDGVRRQLRLIARGADAKSVRYNVVYVDPDFLKVKLGESQLSADEKLSQTPLTIEIPPRDASASGHGGDRGKSGEIHIDTTSPQVHQLRIEVRFSVEGGE